MAASLRASASRTGSSTSVASFILSLDAATVAGDIALVSLICDAGASAVSGLGATWTREQQGNSAGDNTELWVGRGCTAGLTDITVTLSTNDRADGMAVCVNPGASGSVQNTSILVADGGASGAGGGGVFDAPLQTVTVIGQMVIDFFWINGGWTGGRTNTDTPAAFTSLTNASVANWYSEGEHSAYRVSTSLGGHSRRLDTGTAVNQVGALYSILIGDDPPATYRKPPVTIRSQALARSVR